MVSIPAYFARHPVLIVAIGAITLTVGMGIRHGFGLFLEPMTADLGWTRETFALALAFQNLIWGVSQPFAGAAADRFGVGRTIAAGAVLYAVGLYLMATSSTSLDFQLGAGVIVGIALAGTTNAVILGGIGRVVPESWRSLALGITAAGGSAGQFLVVPLGQSFITAYGWSTALLLLAVGALGMVLLAGAFSGVDNGSKGAGKGRAQSLDEALREASRHRGFWLLTLGFYVCGFHVMFIAIHLPAFLSDAGFAPMLGAKALGIIGLFNVFGTITWGALGGRYAKKNMLALLYAARSAVIALFVLMPITEGSVVVFSAAIGFLWLGTLPLTSGLVAVIFGPRYMATLYGIVFLGHQLGSFTGIWLGGYLYDTTGSYDMIWYIGIVLGVMAAVLHWPIAERPVPRLARQAAE